MFAPVEKVAALALVYRELYKARHTGPDDLIEDFQVCPGDLNLLAMIGSQALTEIDWLLIRAMEKPQMFQDLVDDLHDLDLLRVEALVHTGFDEPLWNTWAVQFTGERWFQVEEEMQRLRDEGLVTRRDDIESIAYRAYAEASGRPLEAVLDEWATD